MAQAHYGISRESWKTHLRIHHMFHLIIQLNILSYIHEVYMQHSTFQTASKSDYIETKASLP